MAASSGGLEWTTIIKPILSANYNTFNKQELNLFIKGIIRCGSELLSHEPEYDAFFTAFTALAADSIAACVDNIEKDQLNQVCEATRILLQYILSRLVHLITHESSDTTPQLARLLLLSIQSLCQGQSTLQYADRHSLTSEMKIAKLPTHVRTDPVPSDITKRPRSELIAKIIDQSQSSIPCQVTDPNESDVFIKNQFIAKNIEHLKALKASDKVIDMCLRLPNIVPYIKKCKDDGRHGVISSQTEALAAKQNLGVILTEINFISVVLSLPILEPLENEQLRSLSIISRACLSIALTVSSVAIYLSTNTNNSKNQDEVDQNMISTVEKCIEIYYSATSTISNGNYKHHVTKNHQMLSTSMLLQGLWHQLSSYSEKKEEKGKSPSRTRENSSKVNLQKVQQGFSILSVAVATQTLKFAAELMNELKYETESAAIPDSLTKVDIFAEYTPSQRVSYLLYSAPIHQLLHYLAIITYRKAYTLKRVLKPANEDETVSFSDSTIYNGDDFSFSEDSSGQEDNDDSEPILGHWLESTLAPKVIPENSEIESMREEQSTQANTNLIQNPQVQLSTTGIVPEKGKPNGYIFLSTEIFEFLDKYFLSNNTLLRTSIIANIGEQHMVILAAIIRDLDRETARTKTGTIQQYVGLVLSNLYNNFSHFLTRYTHNLIAENVLSDTLQISLLNHLGVNPVTADAPWPLQVYSRSLGVLTQVIFMKKSEESEAVILRIWSRFINTLAEIIANPSVNVEIENEDLNCEHAQVLLLYFHSNLSLLQKKSVLLSLSNALIRCGEVVRTSPLKESQVYHISRLVHIFEHMLRHLYEPPSVLLEQVNWNLFTAVSLVNNEKTTKTASRMYTSSDDISDSMLRSTSQEESHMKPKFYALTPIEMNNEEVPKLDGLACNFIYTTPEKLNYHDLIVALFNILGVVNQCDEKWFENGQQPSLQMLCAVQFCFLSTWRMLLLLPPSYTILKSMGETKEISPLLLYELVWGPRIGCNVYSGYIKDSLNKQANSQLYIEVILKHLGQYMPSFEYTDVIAQQVIAHIEANLKKLNIFDIIMLDVTISKLLLHLNELKGSNAQVVSKIMGMTPQLLDIYEHLVSFTRTGLVNYIHENNPAGAPNLYLEDILKITSSLNTSTSVITSGLRGLLSAHEKSCLERWNSTKCNYTPIATYNGTQIPSESCIISIIKIHISKLYKSDSYISNESLKRVIYSLVTFFGEVSGEEESKKLVKKVLPTSVDCSLEYLMETLVSAVTELNSEEQQVEVFVELLRYCYSLICSADTTEKITQECFKVMEELLETTNGSTALYQFFAAPNDMSKVLISKSSYSNTYATNAHKFFNKLFTNATKTQKLQLLCANLVKSLATRNRTEISEWLNHLYLEQFYSKSFDEVEEESKLKFDVSVLDECQQLMKSLTSYIVKDTQVGESVATSMLEGLIPIASHMLRLEPVPSIFSDIMLVMVTLANAASTKGHTNLFFAATSWLQHWEDFLPASKLQEGQEILQGEFGNAVEALAQLLSYVADIVTALGPAQGLATQGEDRTDSPTYWDNDLSPDKLDCDFLEDYVDDGNDSTCDDSDEDSLCNKLCTFTLTQTEYMNQHWYHCHTCSMVESMGVCSVCAKVCHKTHDVSYSKFGNFFCDCGAKEDGTCQALVKRNPQTLEDPPTPVASVEQPRHVTSPTVDKSDKFKDEKSKERSNLGLQLTSCSETLMHHIEASPIINNLLELSNLLLKVLKTSCEKNSSIGCHLRAQNALNELHEAAKQFEMSEQLMVPTLGSQEGAFENVRSNYPGEQSQAIRQLLSAHMIRRVAMCCLSSLQGKKQHLAVSHEKGKITLLQLSTLLKQADSSKRQLTLTRLATAPVPFTVLTITGNPCNEDYLAVCGLKDCHVLTFNLAGTVAQHLVLHPHLESGNYIIRAIWLPGSQTQLAVVTADFIKIYDLSKDALSPQYYFLVPTGKIRDATFIFPEDSDPSVLIMSSGGYIYSQAMCEESSAQHGLFYVTNTLEMNHPDIQDVNGLVAGGGVSVYYSHILQLIFFSFSQGKSFFAPLKSLESYEVSRVYQIQMTRNGSNTKTQTVSPQPLCQWSEVLNHPGLVTCVMQSSNNPVILMIKPNTVLVQEIKLVPAKSKIIDIVAIRHVSNTCDLRTTMLLLCEDGSLRIYMANQECTNYWLAPTLQASNMLTSGLKTSKKKKVSKSVQPQASSLNFPVDFFETCTVLDESIEFGGTHLLEIYPVDRIKQRLKAQGQYIANQRPTGFNMDITNNDSSTVITGIRVHVGDHDMLRTPSYFEIQGRSMHLNLTSPRWFNYPLTREESIQADKKLTISFGPSHDPDCYIIVDSIEVYGKTKDSFGWPDDSEEQQSTVVAVENDGQQNQQPLTSIDKAVSGILEVLNGCFVLFNDKQDTQSASAIEVTTKLLTLPTVSLIQSNAKLLLSTLHPSNLSYYQYKDQAILKYVTEVLTNFDQIANSKNLDSELFYRIILMTRSIAANRPYNLTKIAEILCKDKNFIQRLLDNFWRLHSIKPSNVMVAPYCVPGLTHIELTVHAIIEIINAFVSCDIQSVQQAAHQYMKLLLCEDTCVSFSAKQAIVRVLRPRRPVVPEQIVTQADNMEPIRMLEEGAVALEHPIEAGGGAFPANEYADENLVQLAIALNLNEDSPQQDANQGHFSDITGGTSDDESNAATDGSTLRTSPAEQTGWESGGSGADSVEVFERSCPPEGTKSTLPNYNERTLISKLISFFPQLKQVSGVQSIPFLQVIYILTSDLEKNFYSDQKLLEQLILAVANELDMKHPVKEGWECRHTTQLEVQLVLMKFLVVIISRGKTCSKTEDFVTSQMIATTLIDNSLVDYCLTYLKVMLQYWQDGAQEVPQTGALGGSLLKAAITASNLDMSPIFINEGKNTDVFENYQQLLTELVLRLSYQVLKHSENPLTTILDVFGDQWKDITLKYMMSNPPPTIRKQARKLLQFLCGNKVKYRQSRDIHALQFHTNTIIQVCNGTGLNQSEATPIDLPYDQLVSLMEHLKACLEIATIRPFNWQNFCISNENLVPYLFIASCSLDEIVSPTILQLLQIALGKTHKEREKSVESDFEEKEVCTILVNYIMSNVNQDIISLFVKIFLLETNSTAVRWQAHDLIHCLYRNSNSSNQELLKDLLWTIWPDVNKYGKKAAQFVDLLGYFSINTSTHPEKVQEMIEYAVSSLKSQNKILEQNPNSKLYEELLPYVNAKGFFFETLSCLVCNVPEIPLTNIKLSSIKVDSKFTTTAHYVKLVSSHSISRITLRIGELKQAKMVRKINIYYNNRTVQAIVELKNRPNMWNKGKTVTLASEQSEVKVDFPLPIIACNLMIEYCDFYENIQASSDTLQCPRCGVSVPASPGVCGNCGENVYQCHKCRAINYDVKDPFLCHSCGYCKYAKFDYTLSAKPCCAVDPIENIEDRNKTIANISNIEERSYRIYEQLSVHKENIRQLVKNIGQLERLNDDSSTATLVNQHINQVAQIYGVDCKTSFEELGKNTQKVIASRAEIVAYDRKQMGEQAMKRRFLHLSRNTCYGCGIATLDHCLTILRALSTIPASKQILANSGIINELFETNLNSTSAVQVRNLLCLLVKDNPEATFTLFELLTERINKFLDIGDIIKPPLHREMLLLTALMDCEDKCWELKLKYVFKLYFKASQESNYQSSIVTPCLKIFTEYMSPVKPTSELNKDKTVLEMAGIAPSNEELVDVHKWINNEQSFGSWRAKVPRKEASTTATKEEVHGRYLAEKYSRRWKNKVRRQVYITKLCKQGRLRLALFNNSSVARQTACKMIETLFQFQLPQRKLETLNLLSSYLNLLSRAGQTGTEFLALYRNLLQADHWKIYTALNGTLVKIADLLTSEIEKIRQLEESSLVSDLTDGHTLKMLTDLLSNLLERASIKRVYKGRLVGAVLNGYLALRRFAVQRTRLIDETQEKLFELLEEMTSGNEEETKDFMKICMEAVEKCPVEDDLTPVFILERLCSIISPEQNDIGEFFLTLEKDQHQEDFLQGRMLGNPYSSTEPGLGPLMRDVKNKICQDCELVALLEDDTGMELLVNNKIISLDLPVKDVYKKIWLTEGEGESMKVVYRMRGLLGDATEEFIETLENKSKQEVDNEEVFKMANVMCECRGLEILLQRLSKVRNVVSAKSLLQVFLQLLHLCTKVRSNQEQLAHPALGAIGVLLDTLQRCLAAGKSADARLAEQILDILETILTIAASKPLDSFLELSKTFGGPEHIQELLTFASPPSGTPAVNASLLQHLGKVLAALTYGHEDRMALLAKHFSDVWNFERYDTARSTEDEQRMELFCLLAAGIEHSPAGNTLKDHFNALGVVKNAASYISAHAPPTTPVLVTPGSDEWKEFISRPSLKVILRFLAGLAGEHEPTQLEVSTPECVAVLHRLEQVSSEEHVGSLSENLLEALRTNPAVAARIEQVRQETRAEKKRLAMAMREKQLGALGMRANEKGQVVARSALLTQLEELGEETGLTCVICREGYRCQPAKVLGIYTYTKRCPVEEEERKHKRSVTFGYSTVTHFNVVHVDCHMAAVRQARARDEWESAALQNANTKCNGLLPLWGPAVPESAFASCLARHNNYLQECTAHRDIGYSSSIHDLKLLLLRFAQEKPFNEDTGGGGPESNMHLLGYLIHMALYVLNTTRSQPREIKSLTAYLAAGPDTWVQSSFVPDGPLYWAVMSLMLKPTNKWQQADRLPHLKRLLVLAHARHLSRSTSEQVSKAPSKLSDVAPQDYAAYKPYLVFYGLIDGMYRLFFQKVASSSEDQWPSSLADFIRHNDESLLRASDQLLAFYTEELLPCTSFDEFCDVLGLLGEVDDPSTFLTQVLSQCSG